MKKSWLMTIREWVAKRSSTPWAAFETAGPDNSGRLEFRILWNQAFVQNLRRHGFDGGDEEAVHMFFLSTRVLPENLLNDEADGTINPAATPNLTREHANLVR